ncbi:MAG: hypothetical protein ABI193_01875 [Minicystis sp.]
MTAPQTPPPVPAWLLSVAAGLAARAADLCASLLCRPGTPAQLEAVALTLERVRQEEILGALQALSALERGATDPGEARGLGQAIAALRARRGAPSPPKGQRCAGGCGALVDHVAIGGPSMRGRVGPVWCGSCSISSGGIRG